MISCLIFNHTDLLNGEAIMATCWKNVLIMFSLVAIGTIGCESQPTDPMRVSDSSSTECSSCNSAAPEGVGIAGDGEDLEENMEKADTTKMEAPGSNESPNSGPLQLFDAHAHQMPTTFPDNWLDQLLNNHAPVGIVLLGAGDVFRLQRNHPSTVFAFSNFKDVNNIDFAEVESQLQKGSRGIGEVSIRHFPSGPEPQIEVENDFNERDLLKLYDLAASYNVPIIFHFDYHEDHVAEIATTLPSYAETKFIWAHAGDAQPDELTPFLAQFDNLYIDISCRNPLESFKGRLVSTTLQRLDESDGTIKDDWRNLFSDYSDRVLYGSDIGPTGRLEQYGEIRDYYRDILSQLDPTVAEKISQKNAENLFHSN